MPTPGVTEPVMPTSVPPAPSPVPLSAGVPGDTRSSLSPVVPSPSPVVPSPSPVVPSPSPVVPLPSPVVPSPSPVVPSPMSPQAMSQPARLRQAPCWLIEEM